MSIMTDDPLPNGTRRVWTICDNDAHAAAMHAAMMKVSRAAYQPQKPAEWIAEIVSAGGPVPDVDDPESHIAPTMRDNATAGLNHAAAE